MLNNQLDINKLKNTYTLKNRISIKDAFQADVAETLLDCLRSDIPWQLAYKEKGAASLFSAQQLAGMSEEQLQTIYYKIAQLGAQGFQFCYYHYSISHKNNQTCAPDAYVNTFAKFLSSEPFFEFARKVTGIEEINNIEIQAGRYTGNNFLMVHNDSDKPERRVAFVLNLSKDWQIDWGGLLHFMNQKGEVTDTFVPTYNSLTFFTVPVLHKVSYVMPFVKQSRYTVTGWLLET